MTKRKAATKNKPASDTKSSPPDTKNNQRGGGSGGDGGGAGVSVGNTLGDDGWGVDADKFETASATNSEDSNTSNDVFAPKLHWTASVSSTRTQSWYPFWVTGFLFLVYLRTLYPTASGGDSGELIIAAYHLGAAHPPGFPLFTILGFVFIRLVPFGSIAWRMNLMCAMFGASAGGFICATVMIWIRGLKFSVEAVPVGALVAGAMFGLAPSPWLFHTQTEVFALNNLLISVLLYLTVLYSVRPTKTLFHTGIFFAALTLSNHHTGIVYVVPLGFYACLLTGRRLLHVNIVVRGLGFALLGLAPYLQLVYAGYANVLDSFGDQSTLRGLYDHVFGFETTLIQLALKKAKLSAFAPCVLNYFYHYASQCSFVGLPFVCVGLWESLHLRRHSGMRSRRKNQNPTGYWLLLAFLLYVFIFSYLSNVNFSPSFPIFQRRFWMQADIVAFLFLGVGVHSLQCILLQNFGAYTLGDVVIFGVNAADISWPFVWSALRDTVHSLRGIAPPSHLPASVFERRRSLTLSSRGLSPTSPTSPNSGLGRAVCTFARTGSNSPPNTTRDGGSGSGTPHYSNGNGNGSGAHSRGRNTPLATPAQGVSRGPSGANTPSRVGSAYPSRGTSGQNTPRRGSGGLVDFSPSGAYAITPSLRSPSARSVASSESEVPTWAFEGVDDGGDAQALYDEMVANSAAWADQSDPAEAGLPSSSTAFFGAIAAHHHHFASAEAATRGTAGFFGDVGDGGGALEGGSGMFASLEGSSPALPSTASDAGRFVDAFFGSEDTLPVPAEAGRLRVSALATSWLPDLPSPFPSQSEAGTPKFSAPPSPLRTAAAAPPTVTVSKKGKAGTAVTTSATVTEATGKAGKATATATSASPALTEAAERAGTATTTAKEQQQHLQNPGAKPPKHGLEAQQRQGEQQQQQRQQPPSPSLLSPFVPLGPRPTHLTPAAAAIIEHSVRIASMPRNNEPIPPAAILQRVAVLRDRQNAPAIVTILFVVFCAGLVAAHFGLHLRYCDNSGNTVTSDFGRHMLSPLPPHSLLLISGDEHNNAAKYVSRCELYRNDVQIVSMSLLTYPWFIPSQKRFFHQVVWPGERYHPRLASGFNIAQFLQANMDEYDRPVFLSKGFNEQDPSYVDMFDLDPFGLTPRVVRKLQPKKQGVHPQEDEEEEMVDPSGWFEAAYAALPHDFALIDPHVYDDDSWEMRVMQHILSDMLFLAQHYMLHVVQIPGEASALRRVARLYEDYGRCLEVLGKEPDATLYRDAGIAYGKLSVFEPVMQVKMFVYWDIYLLHRPTDQQIQMFVSQKVNPFRKSQGETF